MANDDQLLKRIGNLIDEKLEPVKKDLQDVKRTQEQHTATLGQHTTSLEVVLAGQKELQETVSTKADILTVGVKIDKLRKRVEGIEEDTGKPPRHKN
jgi:hypothetical protein